MKLGSGYIVRWQFAVNMLSVNSGISINDHLEWTDTIQHACKANSENISFMMSHHFLSST